MGKRNNPIFLRAITPIRSNPVLENKAPLPAFHCEHPKGACLHAEVLALIGGGMSSQTVSPARAKAPLRDESKIRRRACALKRSGAQAWQSLVRKRDSFFLLAKTASCVGIWILDSSCKKNQHIIVY